jgi:hypothetical protein
MVLVDAIRFGEGHTFFFLAPKTKEVWHRALPEWVQLQPAPLSLSLECGVRPPGSHLSFSFHRENKARASISSHRLPPPHCVYSKK